MRKNNRLRGSGGFTLIEVVVVLAIMGIIAAFLTPMLFNYLDEAKRTRAENDVKNIGAAISRFNSDTGVFPVYSALPLKSANATVEILSSDGNDAADNSTGSDWNGTSTKTYSSLQNPLEKGLLSNGSSEYNDSTKGLKGRNKWRGPYMTDFKADPWGNKYYVSALGLQPGKDSKVAFVLSAGPNGTIETESDQTFGTSSTFSLGGDDIGYRLK